MVVALGASFMLETPTSASSDHSAQTAQSVPASSSLRLCFTTQKCVPANHPGTSGAVVPVLAYGFIGALALVLADRARRRPGSTVRLTLSPFNSGIFRPPIAS